MLRQMVSALRAQRMEFEVRVTRGPGHATEVAEGEGACWPLVAALGGDGTANEVANGLLALPVRPPLAILPGGSVNAVARFLGLSRQSEALARLLREPTLARLDVGRAEYLGRGGIEERAFLLLAGTGWSARLIERARSYRRLGNASTYVLAGLREWWDASPVAADLDLPSGRHRVMLTDALLVNIPVDGPFLHLAPGAHPADGQLEAIIVTAAGRWKLMGLMGALPRAAHVRHPNVRFERLPWLAIDPERPLPVQLDGELVGQTPLRVRVEPTALRMLVDPQRASAIRGRCGQGRRDRA